MEKQKNKNVKSQISNRSGKRYDTFDIQTLIGRSFEDSIHHDDDHEPGVGNSSL